MRFPFLTRTTKTGPAPLRKRRSRRRGLTQRPSAHKLIFEMLEDRRLLANGALDLTFGDGGLVTTDFGWESLEIGQDVVAVQPDGKIVVVGNSHRGVPHVCGLCLGSLQHRRYSGHNPSAMAARLRPTSIAPRTTRMVWRSMQPVESWVAGRTGFSEDFAIARYNSDGSLDTSFGGDGEGHHRLRVRGTVATMWSSALMARSWSWGHPSKVQLARILPWCATTTMVVWMTPSAATERSPLISAP